MKRLILTLVAAMLGTGCIVDSDDDGGGGGGYYDGYADVIVYWDFIRNAPAQLDGYVVYDAALEGVRGVCPESGVDTVEIVGMGEPYVFDCVEPNGIQGVTLLDIPVGSRSFRVTGWRQDTAVYQSTVTLDVVADGDTFFVDVEALRAPIDLVAYAVEDGPDDVPGNADDFFYATCAEARNPTFRLELWDSYDTKILDEGFGCGAPGDSVDPLLVLQAGYPLDLDNYVARLRGYEGTTQTFDSCGQSFDHFEAQIGIENEVALETYTRPPACSFQ